MQVSAMHLKITGIVQASGALLGILSAVAFPVGGHPSLAVLIGLAVIPLNLILALLQIVSLIFFFSAPSPGEVSNQGGYWSYLIVGWLSTAVFVSWQWPPIFI